MKIFRSILLHIVAFTLVFGATAGTNVFALDKGDIDPRSSPDSRADQPEYENDRDTRRGTGEDEDSRYDEKYAPEWRWGLQYRTMYNSSNIKSKENRDFFQQRLRLDFNVETEEGFGAYTQLEYSGIFGAVDGYDENSSFNRLEPRGIRYGFLFMPIGDGTLKAGLIPLNDKFGQTIFSGDWDLNVGGVAYEMKGEIFDFRLGALKFVDGKDLSNNLNEDKDQHFIVADAGFEMGALKIGLHGYALTGRICSEETPDINCDTALDFKKQEQSWLGLNLSGDFDFLTINASYITNSGKHDEVKNNGYMAKLDISAEMENVSISLMGLTSSGKEGEAADQSRGRGFHTIHSVKGTGGYWGYTYIFSPHGPSDVNDYNINPSNKGFGLTTIQLKADIALTEKLEAQIVGGVFSSNENMHDGTKEYGKDIGHEYGAQLSYVVGKDMILDFGYAAANLGKAGVNMYQGINTGKKDVYEFFSRLQLEF